MEIICLFGAPACGKGTEAALMAADGYVTFSPGAYIRQRAAAGDRLFQDFMEASKRGDLIDDATVTDIVKAHISDTRAAGARGLVLDGFPRTLGQAQALDAFLAEQGLHLTVVELRVDETQLEQRRANRVAQALAAGETPRADDDPATFVHRQQVYQDNTRPLLDYYRQQGNLHSVEATGGPAEVHRQVRLTLGVNGPAPAPAVTPGL